MRIKFLCIIICLFVNALVFASATNHTITGVVISGEDNEPLIGASVYVHADDLKKAGVSQTSLGTITDIDGKFSISVPEKVTRIHCSYIGFEEQAIILQGNKKNYRIVLQPSAHALADVVVTGYQTLERRKLTAAIAKVELSDAMIGANKSIDQALTGQIAGVAVTTTSGAPGAPARIRIRGTASLNGTQDPLWVLDGMPLEGTDIPKLDDATDNDIVNMQQSSIAGLSPNDIESITILKDAAATAIYGARAANGVIVVTTKRGRTGKPIINFNTKLTYTPNLDTSRLNLLNSQEKVDLELQLLKNNQSIYPNKGGVATILNKYNLMNQYLQNGWEGLSPEAQNAINQLKTMQTDWNDILFRDAFTQEYNISISGGTEKTTYYNSLGYSKENGNVPGVSMTRFNLTSKTSYQINKILKIGVSIFANRRKNQNFVSDKYGYSNPVFYSRTANPYFYPYDAEHNYQYDYDILPGDEPDLKRGFNIFEEREKVFIKEPVWAAALGAHAVRAPAHHLHHLANFALFQQLLCVHRALHMQTLAEVAEVFLPSLTHGLAHLFQMLGRNERRLIHKEILAVAHSFHAQRAAVQRDGCRSNHLHVGSIYFFLAGSGFCGGKCLLELRHFFGVGVVHQGDLSTGLGQAVAHAVDMAMVQPDDTHRELTLGTHRL